MTISTEDVAKTFKCIRRNVILNTVYDSVGDLLYYDRKEDEDLPLGAIESAVQNGEITVDEIVAKFKERLTSACK